MYTISKLCELMDEPIYFSKIEYRERIGYGKVRSVLLLNLVEGELSYQVYKWKREMPVIRGTDHLLFKNGKTIDIDINLLARIIKNDKTDFKQILLPTDVYSQEVCFSYAVKLTKDQMDKLRPYCNALEFEPFRNREMSMDDEGYIGYRDEVQLAFTGITDSYIPKIELPMNYYYDDEHIWPSEHLYRYLAYTYLDNNKKLKGWFTTYGGLSLFF